MPDNSPNQQLENDLISGVDKVKHFPGAFYIHDSVSDKIVHMSERIEEYVGYSVNEIREFEFGGRSLIHPEDISHVVEMNEARMDLKDGAFVEATYRMLHKSGNWVWLRSEKYVFSRDETGKPTSCIGVVHDVTPLKARELQLEKMADYNSFLVATSRLVTEGSVDIKATLQEMARMISEQFQVVCSIFFLEESNDSIQPSAVFYRDQEIVDILKGLFEKYTVKHGEGMVGKVIQDGSEFILHEVDKDIRERTIAVDPRLEPVGLAYLPLKGYSKIIGAINLTRLVEFDPLSKNEWESIAQVVRNVSLFVEHSLITNARKLELERLAKAEQEIRESKEGTSFLLEVSHLAADLEKEQDVVLKNLAKCLSLHFESVCDIHIVDDADLLQPRAWYHREKSVRDKVEEQYSKGRFKVGQGIMGVVAENGEEHLVRVVPKSLQDKLTIDPEIIPESFIYVPLTGVSKVVGVLGLARLNGQPGFSDVELVRIRNAANTVSEFLAKRHLHDARIQELEKRTKAEADLKELNRQNEFLLSLSSRVSDLTSDMKEVLQGLTDTVRDHFGVVCSVHIVKTEYSRLYPLAVSHPNIKTGTKIKEFFERHHFDVDYSMISKVVQDGQEFHIPKVTKKDHKWFDSDDPDLIPTSLLFMPMVGRSSVLGILDISKIKSGEEIKESEAVYLREVAKIVALFIENHHLFSKHKTELAKRKKVEDLLRLQNDKVMRNEQELREILDAMPILVSRINLDYRYLFANKSFKKVLGLDPEKIVGKHVSEIMSGDTFNSVMPNLDKVKAGETLSYKTTSSMKNGVVRHFDVVHSPDLDANGNVRGILSCIVDITDWAKAEQDLEISETRLKIIFENVEDVITTFNEEGRLESVNRTSQGLTKEDVIDSHILDFYQNPVKRRHVQINLDSLILEGKPFAMEHKYTGLDGSEHWYANRYAAVREGGRFIKGIVVTRDVTGQKQEEKAIMTGMLQGQEVERKRLAAEMHDGIGQILAAISIELSQLSHKKSQVKSSDISQVSDKVQSAITEVRIISHALKPDVLENFGLVSAIQEVVDSASTSIGPDISFNHIDVERRFYENVEINLYRSLQELITNCLKHANAKDIFITLIYDEGKLILTVEDDGDGFKEQDHTGIGINNVRSRIALIGGTVTIDSSVGKGSLINIEVPIEDE